MSDYTPRPGSKTEAAVEYLRAKGGAAIAIALAEAIDTDRKNLQALFKPAVDHGLIEPCDLPEGFGYRLAGTDAPGTQREAPQRKRKPAAALPALPTLGSLGQAPKRGRGRPRKSDAPAQATKGKASRKAKVQPVPAPFPAKEAAGAYPVPEFLRAKPSDPVATAPAFRIGQYSDGSIRLEGLEPAMALTHNAGEGPCACMLSPAAARTLVEFLHPGEARA